MQEKYLRFRFLGSCFIFCGFLQVIENYSVDFMVKSSQVFPVLISITLANFMWTLYDLLNDLSRYFTMQEDAYHKISSIYNTESDEHEIEL